VGNDKIKSTGFTSSISVTFRLQNKYSKLYN